MSIKLSVKAEALLKQVGIQPQIILDIEGVDLIFGARPIYKTLFWDDDSAAAKWDNGLTWDGVLPDERSRDYISLSETTTEITQQIEPDKGSINSISTVNISLVDKNNEVSKALSFDSISEILGKKAIFSIGFDSGAYPEDATPIFRGVIVDYYSSGSMVMVSIASPESLKKQMLLETFNSKITSAINSSQASINILSTVGIYKPQDALKTYIKVDDELMEVVSINSSTNLTVLRGQLTTVASSHDADATLDTFYRLQGRPLDLALKIMLSKEGNSFFTSDDIPRSIEFVNNDLSISNAIVFKYYDIKEKTGLAPGDKIKLNSPLNTGTYTVLDFGLLDGNESYIIVSENLNQEIEYNYGLQYKSQYNVLSTGLGMLTSEVDIDQFNLIDIQFGANFVDYDIYIKETIDDCKYFIDQEIYFPQGLYSIPRKARSSVKFIAPPFSSDIVPLIDHNSIINAPSIRQRRSVHRFLYNTFVFRYELDPLEDKFLAGKISISSNSLDRINVGKKQLEIKSLGLRDNSSTELMIENVSQRLIDRYQYAPVYFEGIGINYKTGYKLEVGDIIPFGGKDLQVIDLKTGSKGTPYSLFEITNKSLNVINGEISLSIAQTDFDIYARYAVISLSSLVVGGTVDRIKIDKIVNSSDFNIESSKWRDYIGQTVRVRSEDYLFDEETVLKGIDQSDVSYLFIDPPLSLAPAGEMIIEPAIYSGDSDFNSLFKIQFSHNVPRAIVTSVASNQEFDVDIPGEIFAGSRIVVNSTGFNRDSFGELVVIDSVVGNTITLVDPLSFTPLIGDYVNNTNFSDGGFPYLLI